MPVQEAKHTEDCQSRPKPEIDAIKKLVVKAINEQVPDLKKQKVKLKFFGEIEDFGSKILSKIDEAETATDEYEPDRKSVV